MTADRSSALYGTLLLTATGLFNQLLGFFYRILLSRLIGPEVMGLYQLVMPVYSLLLSVSAVGLTAAVSQLTARYHALGDRAAAGQILRRCLRLLVLLLALPTLAVLGWSDPISVYLLGDARTRLALVLLLPCALLTGVENLHKHAFYGAGLVRTPAFTEVAEQVIRAGAVLGLLALFLPQTPERTVGLIAAGMGICEVFSACTLTLLYRRRLGGAERSRPLARREADRQIVAVALPVAANALLGNLMASACTVLIPQLLVRGGMEVSAAISAFGVLFGMTLPLLGLPTAFIGALGLVLVPRLARSAALGRREEICRRVSRAMLAASVLLLPALAFLVVLGPTLGELLFREPAVGDCLVPLAAATGLGCWQSVLGCALNGIGRQQISARNSLICGGAELALVVLTVGIPGVGLKGYVLAALVSAGLGVILGMASLRRAVGWKPQLFQWLTAPALAALLMGLLTNLLFRALTDAGLGVGTAGSACLVFGTGLYLVALWVQGVEVRALFRVK